MMASLSFHRLLEMQKQRITTTRVASANLFKWIIRRRAPCEGKWESGWRCCTYSYLHKEPKRAVVGGTRTKRLIFVARGDLISSCLMGVTEAMEPDSYWLLSNSPYACVSTLKSLSNPTLDQLGMLFSPPGHCREILVSIVVLRSLFQHLFCSPRLVGCAAVTQTFLGRAAAEVRHGWKPGDETFWVGLPEPGFLFGFRQFTWHQVITKWLKLALSDKGFINSAFCPG